MGTRNDLRGFLKQSQKTPADAPGSRNRKECDELVKYMSKLPGYLQGEEDESIQSNALNVGVMDWSRLEKWKHGRARDADRCERRVSSTTTTTLGTLPNASHHRCEIGDGDHQVRPCSNPRKKVKEASRDLQHGVRCTLEPELASSSSRDSLNKQDMPTWSYNKSSARDQERVKSRRSRSSSALLSTMGNSGGSLGGKGSFVVREKETEKRDIGKQCGDKLDGEDKTVGASNAGLTCEKHQVVSNIVLLRSRKQSTLSSEPLMSSLDDNVKVTREVNCSLDFSDGINSSLGFMRSQFPRSCPLSSDLERDSEDMMLRPLLGVDLSGRKERSGRSKGHSKTASRMFDQEIQQEKKRDPCSPSKRFSFSFGRLSRSFTFREDSSATDDTIKSDSMRFDGLACPSQSSNPEEKQNTHCGTRVSPLRRLLDPLMKPKVSENALLPSKARSSSFNQDEEKKQDASRTRALLQLTIRNGIPLFQFVVDDDKLNKSKRRSILGATMKSSDASSLVKDDSVQYCTFYSVNEVKKKRSGSWLIHGHNKEKQQQQQRFVYNVIGEMRLCNSPTEQKSENISYVMRESVLVDETEGVKGRKEVAAMVIKKRKKAAEENGETTVIIPGGVHSTPEKGEPTPLIRRWRSGGCCDCGGWDVGCKLHVLSNKTFLHDLDQTFKLFHQEESDKNCGPVLEMTELKRGIYRVEFGSFLSHLQAFFVCVTVISCASEEEETMSKTTTGRSFSPFAPPLSPVGRA